MGAYPGEAEVCRAPGTAQGARHLALPLVPAPREAHPDATHLLHPQNPGALAGALADCFARHPPAS